MSDRRATTKLTAVTITYNGKKLQEFLWLQYDQGRAVMGNSQLNGLLDRMKVPRGATYSIG